MRYWVYVDKPTKRVLLHKSTCGACNDGEGMHGHRDPKLNWWTDSFASRDDAWNYAQSEARKLRTQPAVCSLCHP